MRLYYVELRRQLKTKSVSILIAIGFLLTLVLSYLPISYIEYTYESDNGTTVAVSGIEAIRMRKAAWEEYTGKIEPEKIAAALMQYQEALRQYGEDGIFTGDMPASEYYEKIAPIYRWIYRLREVYANPQTGSAAEIGNLSEQEALEFYDQCYQRLDALMSMEQQEHPSAISQAQQMYGNVEMPFIYYPGVDGAVIDYMVFLIVFLVIIGVIIAAPVFSSEYQTGSDQILRCTKHGMHKLASTKVKVTLSIVTALYIICTLIFFIIVNTALGWDGCKTSIQVAFSATCFLPINIGQIQIITMVAGLFALLASVCLILLLSSKLNTVYTTTVIALLLCFVPMILNAVFSGNIGMWIRCLFPTGGVGLSNSFFYELIDINFIYAGSISIWIPFALLGFSIIEIPIWSALTFRSYIKHQV